jgi:HAD superfamily hydrolase (TIGR01509 family)
MTEIRHIVFDLGNVLVRWNPELPYRRLIPDPAARQRFLAEICNGDWLIETDRGQSWPEAEAALIARHPGEAEMIRAFRRNWHEMVPGLVEGSEEILSDLLAHGHDVTALTNFAADTFLEAQPRFPVLSRFRGVTVSASTGYAKPDPEIYRHHAEAFGLSPAHTLFFDDTMRNIVAAREAGWHAEQFVGAAQMRADLRRYGVALGDARSGTT